MNKKILKIQFERKAEKFFDKNNFSKGEVSELIIRGIKKLRGDAENIDMKRLKGAYKGYLRIRKGDLRIIFKAMEDEYLITVTVTNIDYRGSIY